MEMSCNLLLQGKSMSVNAFEEMHTNLLGLDDILSLSRAFVMEGILIDLGDGMGQCAYLLVRL